LSRKNKHHGNDIVKEHNAQLFGTSFLATLGQKKARWTSTQHQLLVSITPQLLLALLSHYIKLPWTYEEASL